MKRDTGSIAQGGLFHEADDYLHEDLNHSVVGVVLNVFKADSVLNTASTSAPNQKSSSNEARILVVRGITDTPWIIPNVTILPPSGSGNDDFSEELPTPTTGAIDGSSVRADFRNADPQKLNGDWCVVQFIGGQIEQPVMTHWFPHPSNKKDANTERADLGHLEQNRRLAKRFQGMRWVVTSKGSILVDTSKSNHKIKTNRVDRDEVSGGGDVRVTVKQDRELEVNFNPLTFDETEPDFLWEKREINGNKDRDDTNTRLILDKDNIQALAGQVAEIIAPQLVQIVSEQVVDILGQQKVEIASDSNVYIGREASAQENLVLGQEFKSLLQKILSALETHIHATGVGPSGPPLPPELNEFTDANSSVGSEDQLSTWAFTQKDPP